jgi:hypothetical protein
MTATTFGRTQVERRRWTMTKRTDQGGVAEAERKAAALVVGGMKVW